MKTLWRTVLVPLAALLALPVAAQVQVGETAPLVTSVDENLHPLSMAHMAAGAPLVFLHGSAT